MLKNERRRNKDINSKLSSNFYHVVIVTFSKKHKTYKYLFPIVLLVLYFYILASDISDNFKIGSWCIDLTYKTTRQDLVETNQITFLILVFKKKAWQSGNSIRLICRVRRVISLKSPNGDSIYTTSC